MEEKFTFEKFTDAGSKLGNYSISITMNSSFGLNSGFYNNEKIKNYSHVMLFYDKLKRTIGFIFTKDKGEKGGTFKITHGNKSGYISARSFFISILGGNLNEVKRYAGRYTPKTYKDEKIGTLFYIKLEDHETKI
ncbi:MAG: hypothetical protein WA126_14700 [Thermodesulfovibrionales bacterium]